MLSVGQARRRAKRSLRRVAARLAQTHEPTQPREPTTEEVLTQAHTLAMRGQLGEEALLEAAREMGVLVGKGGLDGNVLRIKPPMCITAEDADFTLDVLDRALSAVAK